MNTKDKILEGALKLFNEQGTENITVRHIAKEIGISHGNLCYHFTNTDIIITKLYENLVEELTVEINMLHVKEVDLWMFEKTGRITFSLLYKYKFLMLDFTGIMRRIEGIKVHYKALVKRRRIEFGMALQLLEKGGYLKPQPIEGFYDQVIEVNFIIGDFWVSRSEIIFEGPENEKLNYYLSLMFVPLIASFTEKGMKQYKEIANEWS